jgi:hypothetical protein
MRKHEIDDIGLPTDPELRRLQFELGDLVGAWVEAYGEPERQEQIVREYHDTLHQMYQLGWSGVLAADSELPKALMPREYVEKNARRYSKGVW